LPDRGHQNTGNGLLFVGNAIASTLTELGLPHFLKSSHESRRWRLRPVVEENKIVKTLSILGNARERVLACRFKQLRPDNRAEWTFGHLISWHFERGTRPGGSLDRAGRSWTSKTFAGALGYSDRTVRYWLTGEIAPGDLETVELKLFGTDDQYSEWRLELRRAFNAFESREASGKVEAFPASPEQSADTASAQLLPAYRIPIRVPPHFIGRAVELQQIKDAFDGYDNDQTVVLVLHGLRGIGKTTLAAAYAERHRREFRATWWIRAHDESMMRTDIVALGTRLGWIHPQTGEEAAFSTVMERLSYESKQILLIYDNALDADSLVNFLPRSGSARILVTSNFHAFRGLAAEIIDIQVWAQEVGAAYLAIRTKRNDEPEAAQALSKALDGLPLAHEQAAAYCDRLGVSLSEYLRLFSNTPVPFLDDTAHAPIDHNNRMTVARSFTLGIDEAKNKHSGAEQLIFCASLMAPEPIPLFFFSESRTKFDETFATALADNGVNEAIAALRSFALIKREEIVDERNQTIRTDTIRLHRLVREMASSSRDAQDRNAIRRTIVNALAEVYPRDVFDDPSTWPRARRLHAHAKLLVTFETLSLDGIEGPISELLNRLASFTQAALTEYSEAKSFYERALLIRERTFGPEHPLTATSLHNLARLLRDQGQFSEAQELFERALAIREKVCGRDHLETAATLTNLASLLQARGRLPLVRPLFERALEIRETLCGPEHPKTAAGLINVARALRDQKHFVDALPFAERGLAIRERVLGPEHPRTAAALNVLGNILHGLARFADARPLLERALAICEKVLGTEHPYTATTIANFAHLLQAEENCAEAMRFFERALAVREKVLGHDHPSTATSLNEIGCALLERSDFESARPVFDRALRIAERILGPEHPVTATSLFGIAKLLMEDKDLDGARRLLHRVSLTRENSLGGEHPDTILCKKVLLDLK
jgi:tetratricopeptide (TPR) repeat protein